MASFEFRSLAEKVSFWGQQGNINSTMKETTQHVSLQKKCSRPFVSFLYKENPFFVLLHQKQHSLHGLTSGLDHVMATVRGEISVEFWNFWNCLYFTEIRQTMTMRI